MRFRSRLQIGPKLTGTFTQEQIKNEVMLFNADVDFAWRYGGPITQAWLNAMTTARLLSDSCVIDTRVHMLMPGWYPCIPGWHHDDVPRMPDVAGQPNYDNPAYFSKHCCALVNAGVAPTEFLTGLIDVPEPVAGRVTYEMWDSHLGDGLSHGDVIVAPEAQCLFFDADTFHRGVPAVKSGWRWFGRASWDTDRKPTNEIRRQVQVYLGVVNAGW